MKRLMKEVISRITEDVADCISTSRVSSIIFTNDLKNAVKFLEECYVKGSFCITEGFVNKFIAEICLLDQAAEGEDIRIEVIDPIMKYAVEDALFVSKAGALLSALHVHGKPIYNTDRQFEIIRNLNPRRYHFIELVSTYAIGSPNSAFTVYGASTLFRLVESNMENATSIEEMLSPIEIPGRSIANNRTIAELKRDGEFANFDPMAKLITNFIKNIAWATKMSQLRYQSQFKLR